MSLTVHLAEARVFVRCSLAAQDTNGTLNEVAGLRSRMVQGHEEHEDSADLAAADGGHAV